MGKVTNIEYGNIDYENVNIESGNIEFIFENGNIDSKNGVDPVLLSMLPFSKINSMLPSLWFWFNQPPHFSMFPYSMLFASILEINCITAH